MNNDNCFSFFVIFFFIWFSSMQYVVGFTSINTGLAPEWITALTGEANVKFGTITSSPFFMFNVFKANCKAVVPFETGKQCFILEKLENFFQINLHIYL